MKALFGCLAVLTFVTVAAVAETVALKEHRLSLDVPKEWRQVPAAGDSLLQAQTPDRRTRMFLRKPTLDARAKLTDPKFQAAVRQSLVPAAFTNVVRSEVIKFAGKDAYLIEADRTAPSDSVLAVVFPHQGAMHSLTFLSLGKSVGADTNVQSVIKSVKVLK
jgi:hypothetical protein